MRGSALNLVDQFIRFIAAFVMTPIMVVALGQERYGLWILLMSILGHYSLLDFGLSLSLNRFFARAIGAEDRKELATLVTSSLFLTFKIAGVAVLLTLGGTLVAPFLVAEDADPLLVQRIVLIYGLYLAAGFPVRICRSLLKSRLRYDLLAIASTLQALTSNILIYWAITHGHGLLALAIINVGAGLIEYGFVIWKSLGDPDNQFQISRRYIDREKTRELLCYSASTFVATLGAGLRSRIDPIIIGSLVGYTSVTVYSVAARFPVYMADVLGGILGGQLLALFSLSQGRDGALETSNRQLLLSTRIATVLTTYAGGSMMFFGKDFIIRWMGSEFADSGRILMILTVPYMLMLMQYPCSSYFYSLAKQKYLAVLTISAGLFNAVLSLLLVRPLGVDGVVWASLVEATISYLLVMPWLACKLGGIPFSAFYWDSLFKPMLLSLMILIPIFVASSPALNADYVRLGALGAIHFILFLPAAYFLVLDPNEREQIFLAIRRR